MRIGTGSYLDESRWLMTEAADARDTSCSRDRPPYTTPIRSWATDQKPQKMVCDMCEGL